MAARMEPNTAATLLPQARTEEPYLNVLRCAAMYLVVMLHSFAPFYTNISLFGTRTWWAMNLMTPITRMGVPLFFMISGYLALSKERTRQIRPFYQKQIGKLILPFLFWNLFYFIFNGFLYHNSMNPLLFFTQLFQHGSKYHLWFLYQIIALYLLAPFLKRIVDHCSFKELFLLLFLILLQPSVFHFFNTIQTTISIAPFKALIEGYAGFFLYGYLLGTVTLSPRIKGLIYLGGIMGLSLSVFGNHWMSSPQLLNFQWNAGYSITHFLTSGACFVFIKDRFKAQDQPPRRWKSTLTLWANRISKLTFGIYLSHVMMLELFRALQHAAGITLTPAVQIICSFLAASVGSTVLAYLLSRIPSRTNII
ncbi:MAG: acyltransferase [Oscillospiraceae bacterium]